MIATTRICEGKLKGGVMLDFDAIYGAYEQCESIPEATLATTNALGELGLTQFVYLCWSQETLSVELSIHTYSQAWTERYVAEGYDRIDPVIGLAFQERDPFLWSAEDYVGNDEVSAFFREADRFGLYQGVTIPFKTTPNRRIFLTFAAPKSSTRFQRVRDQAAFMPTVKFLALSLHRTISRNQTAHLALLTAREAQAMKMAATGLNSLEIAAALSLSKATVDEMLTKVARKLGQENRASTCHMLGADFKKLTKP